MSLIEELGDLAVVSRLKRLSERMHQDISLACKTLQIDFEPRWFLLLYLLDKQSPCSISQASQELNVTHPTINHLAEELIKRGFVTAIQDTQDKRKRLLQLTEDGGTLLSSVKPLWIKIHQAAQDVITESGYNVIEVIEKLETSLNKKSYYDRILSYANPENL